MALKKSFFLRWLNYNAFSQIHSIVIISIKYKRRPEFSSPALFIADIESHAVKSQIGFLKDFPALLQQGVKIGVT